MARRKSPDAPATPAFTPVATRARHDGWTPRKQVAFIEALAESACVDEAAKAVGVSRVSAYRLRARIDAQAFRVAWDAALDFAIRRLSDAAFSRALNGVAIPHYYQGEVVGEHRRYDNRLTMFLLRYRDPLRYAATLDKMVYSGHAEAAAIGFAKARDRLAVAAHGDDGTAADEAMAAAGPPYSHTVQPDAAAIRAMIEEERAEADRQRDEAERQARESIDGLMRRLASDSAPGVPGGRDGG